VSIFVTLVRNEQFRPHYILYIGNIWVEVSVSNIVEAVPNSSIKKMFTNLFKQFLQVISLEFLIVLCGPCMIIDFIHHSTTYLGGSKEPDHDIVITHNVILCIIGVVFFKETARGLMLKVVTPRTVLVCYFTNKMGWNISVQTFTLSDSWRNYSISLPHLLELLHLIHHW